MPIKYLTAMLTAAFIFRKCYVGARSDCVDVWNRSSDRFQRNGRERR